MQMIVYFISAAPVTPRASTRREIAGPGGRAVIS